MLEQKIKAQLGELCFLVISLQEQLEQAQKNIEQLTSKEKTSKNA